jgi:hypothetical protein
MPLIRIKKKVIYIKHACGLIDHVTPKVSNKIDNIIEWHMIVLNIDLHLQPNHGRYKAWTGWHPPVFLSQTKYYPSSNSLKIPDTRCGKSKDRRYNSQKKKDERASNAV